MKQTEPVRSDIVLVGGGHAHVHVVTAFAMRPEPGVRITLIARDLMTPYSGMLPGVVAGLYTSEQAHIDLVRLAAATGTRLIHAEAVGFDRVDKRVLLAGRAPIAYDIASIDVGIEPALEQIAGAAEHAIAVKPIGSFLHKFDALLARSRQAGGPRRIAVIGGGAGGVELLMSARERLITNARQAGQDAAALSFALFTDGEILATHNPRVRAAFRRVFSERRIALHEHSRARAITTDTIELDNGERIAADAVLMTTDGAAPAWLAGTGLALDTRGFLVVGPTLQVTDDPDVFAAGDCAALTATPREKAGVYAVRAGPPLADNLRRRVRGEPVKPWWPQRRHLALISTGEKYAVASRGGFKGEGAWLWTLKDWIDRRWMRMYQDTDRMIARMKTRAAGNAQITDTIDEMRCGGCAAKIGPAPLSRALARLAPPHAAADVVVGLDAPDDAAVILPTPGKHLLQSVDFFRAFIDDPFVFGEIAANHALNDIFAMGGVPRHALANAVVPYGPAAKTEETLFQLLAGASACLDAEGVGLVGGHSSEGADMALGFSVTGEIAPDEIIRKGGLQTGDVLILTKPLGTGILFAAAMRARANANAIAAAISEMRRSNRQASEILAAHRPTAMTDVTGFGFAGHLGEMLGASGAAATIDLSTLPLYDSVLDLACAGVASTLLPENLVLARVLENRPDAATMAVLFDPQTSGGLLAGIPVAKADACLAALRAAGYASAAAIGRVTETGLAPVAVKILPAEALRSGA
jgi:selenide,water dikinase